ncbi:MAG: SHOCT domain-containing protein [Clostridia bacterium]|nr:SHOCT domain-containing protein [Clostridia bacterium]
MEDEQLRRNVNGFLTLCIAVLTLIALVIPIETVVEHYTDYYGEYYFTSNYVGLDLMVFKYKSWYSIIVGVLSWLQFAFAVASIVCVALSFKKLARHSKLINKVVVFGCIGFIGLYFLFGLISIVWGCIASTNLSRLIYTSYSFVPFVLTLGLFVFMAKLNKKYGRRKSTATKADGGSSIEKITEYKKLLDEGKISQDEFDELKTKILYGEGLQK